MLGQRTAAWRAQHLAPCTLHEIAHIPHADPMRIPCGSHADPMRILCRGRALRPSIPHLPHLPLGSHEDPMRIPSAASIALLSHPAPTLRDNPAKWRRARRLSRLLVAPTPPHAARLTRHADFAQASASGFCSDCAIPQHDRDPILLAIRRPLSRRTTLGGRVDAVCTRYPGERRGPAPRELGGSVHMLAAGPFARQGDCRLLHLLLLLHWRPLRCRYRCRYKRRGCGDPHWGF